jgi:tRNA (cmo5U34)-methyltransferase
MTRKSSVDEIRERFDKDVERFSNLDTGQSATMDAPLVLELIASSAGAINAGARDLLDIGCGAGNYSLKLLERLPGLNVTLVDLSRPMLDRALERVSAATAGRVATIQADIRDLDLHAGAFDVIVAAAVFHHFRTVDEWRAVFTKCHTALRTGGSIWIADFVSQERPEVQALMWDRYGDYLVALRGIPYREEVRAYVEREDTPWPATEQLALLREVGFRNVDLLHKNACFAAFGAVKA